MVRAFYWCLLCLICFSFQAIGQNKSSKKTEGKAAAKVIVPDTLEYDHFYLMYVDNSRAERGDELTGTAKDLIERSADSVGKAKDTRFFIYASNGIDPVICDDPKQVSKLVSSIMDGENTSFPDDKSVDKEQLRNAIYNVPFRVIKDMRVDYFVTEFFAKSLLKEDGNYLIASFINELNFMLAAENVPVNVNFYYTNKTNEAKKEQISNLLAFKNTGKSVRFNIIPLN